MSHEWCSVCRKRIKETGSCAPFQKNVLDARDLELGRILDELINEIEWSVQVPGAVSIDRKKEQIAAEEARKSILTWHDKWRNKPNE